LFLLGNNGWKCHICSDAEKTLNQLISAINTPGTSVAEDTDTGFVKLTAANQIKMYGITATDGATYMT